MTPPVDRVAFSILGIDIMWYAVLIALGMLLAIFFADREAKRRGFDRDEMSNLLVISILVGILGARLYYVAFEWEYYSQNVGEILNFRQGGLAIYGGIIAGGIAGVIYCKIKGLNPLEAADIAMPSVALAQSIGRWGNFINQEAYGYPTDFPIAVNIDGTMHHATFLYESIGDFIIFLFLTYFARNKQKYHGQVLALYMILYGILRFLVEGLRMDSLYFMGIRISQLVSIVGIVLGILILVFGRKDKLKINKRLN